MGYSNTFLGNDPSMTGTICHSTDLVPLNMAGRVQPSPNIHARQCFFKAFKHFYWSFSPAYYNKDFIHTLTRSIPPFQSDMLVYIQLSQDLDKRSYIVYI